MDTKTTSRLASGTKATRTPQAGWERTILSAISRRPGWEMGRITDPVDGFVHAVLRDGDFTAKVGRKASTSGWIWEVSRNGEPQCDDLNHHTGPTSCMREAEKAIADIRAQILTTPAQMLSELSTYVAWHELDVTSAGVGHCYIAGKFGMRIALGHRLTLPGLLALAPTVDGPSLTAYLFDNGDKPQEICLDLHGTLLGAPIEISLYGLGSTVVGDLHLRIPELADAPRCKHIPVPFDIVKQYADELRAAEAVQA
ncbi:MAG: hypothetical protein HOV67_34690 [Kribbellaceae bacterium]|nr:hypothetical protein [Kribbellaceae bacterium]